LKNDENKFATNTLFDDSSDIHIKQKIDKKNFINNKNKKKFTEKN
jgi:hypothetical protein